MELYSLFRSDLDGTEIQKRGHICTRVAHLLCCTAENNIVKQLYSNTNFLKMENCIPIGGIYTHCFPCSTHASRAVSYWNPLLQICSAVILLIKMVINMH